MTAVDKLCTLRLLLLAVFPLLAPFAARDATLYTYTGNAFNEFPHAGFACPPVCNLPCPRR